MTKDEALSHIAAIVHDGWLHYMTYKDMIHYVEELSRPFRGTWKHRSEGEAAVIDAIRAADGGTYMMQDQPWLGHNPYE